MCILQLNSVLTRMMTSWKITGRSLITATDTRCLSFRSSSLESGAVTWMWLWAMITPSFSSSVPQGPSMVMAPEPATSPDSRTGALTPSSMQSLLDSSTWVALRAGPRTATRSFRPLGPTSVTRCSDRNWPG